MGIRRQPVPAWFSDLFLAGFRKTSVAPFHVDPARRFCKRGKDPLSCFLLCVTAASQWSAAPLCSASHKVDVILLPSISSASPQVLGLQLCFCGYLLFCCQEEVKFQFPLTEDFRDLPWV